MVLRIRVYLAFVFLSVTLLILAASFYFLFDFLQKETTKQIVSQQQSTVVSAAAGIDLVAFESLVRLLGNPNLTRETIESVEASPAYRKISDYLNKIRDSQPSLYLYVYTLFPTDKPTEARFVVDADVLAAKQHLYRGKSLDTPLSHFGQRYDISRQPDTQRALQEHKVAVNAQFVEDPEYHTASLMAFAPIEEPGTRRFLGVLGIDISRNNYSVFMGQLFLWGLFILGLTGLVAIAISLVISTFIVKPIQELTSDVLALSRQQLRTRNRSKTFIAELEDLNTGFNQMADSIEDKQNSLLAHNASMVRFVPTEFLTYLHRENHLQVALGDQILKNLTIMFSDLRGFTALSETMTPQGTIDFLNGYFAKVSPLIRSHGGFIDKFLGDGILSVFPAGPADALHAAIAMQRAVEGQDRIRIGSAIHYGEVVLGTVGEEARLQTTVISDIVNTTSRLEGMNNYLGTSLLISGAVFDELSDSDEFEVRELGPLVIRGKKDGVRTYEVLDPLPTAEREAKQRSTPEFRRGCDLFEQKAWAEARTVFQGLLEAQPDDRVHQYYLSQIQLMEQDPLFFARSLTP